MSFLHDPVEETAEYKKAMETIQPMLDKEFPQNQYRMGLCHRIWYRKKELLKEHGIEWKSPSEMNPDTRFD